MTDLMEAQVPDTGAQLSDMPTEVLVMICRWLGLRDRHSLASSKEAWGALDFAPMRRKKMLSLLAWLAHRRQGLRHLKLDFEWGHLGYNIWDVQTQLTACLGGSPLVCLQLSGTGNLVKEGGAEQQWLGSCTALTSLSLARCGLHCLPGTLERLPALAELSLDNNCQLGEASWGQLWQLAALTRLDISYCQLNSLPAELAALPALAELNLDDNGGLGGGDWSPFQQLTALTRLDISGCELVSLPAEVAALPALAELNLACNSELGGAGWGPLQQLTALTRLDVSCCGLDSLPAELAALSALAALELAWNEELNAAAEEAWTLLAQCSALTSLGLGGIPFAALPPALAALAPRLVSLEVGGTSEKGLGTGGEAALGPLLSLTGLTRLVLDYGRREDSILLPEELSGLVALQDLELSCAYSKCKWESLAPLRHLTALIRLDLSYCGLKDLPEELSHLQALKDLCLKWNMLRCEDISWQPLGRLTGLTKLDLSACSLKRLPPVLSELCRLADLDVCNNWGWGESAAAHAARWAALEQLTALTRLDASKCELVAVPAVFAVLPGLQVLDLSDNRGLGRGGVEALRPLTRMTALEHLNLHDCTLPKELEVDAIPFPLYRLEDWTERLEGVPMSMCQNYGDISKWASWQRLSDSSDSE